MENPELANTSTKLDKKKKSKLYSDKHGGSSDQEAFLHVDADVKPRRSFWKNLFRKQPKKSEVPEMVTDEKAAVLTSRLNAIFEEPKTPEEKEHVVEEIEEIKKTLKRISPSLEAPVSVLLSGIVPEVDPLLDSLSASSSSSAASLAGAQTRDSLDAFIAKLAPADAGEPKPRESSLGRDGYSFEYSEASDNLSADENKDNKVLTFAEKVEQKDADSNIVVGELNPGNDAAEDDTLAGTEVEMGSLGADREEVMTGSGVMLVLPPSSKIPVAVAPQPISKPPQTKRFPDTLATSGSSQVLNMCHTSPPPSPPAPSPSPTKQAVPKRSGSRDSLLLDEADVWNEKLKELSAGFSSNMAAAASVLPTAALDDSDTGYREYRLDDFFKMVFRQTADDQLLNYSVAYDPIFASFNVQCRQPPNLGENTSDKQKVVRRRKMMSLLRDRGKMAEYLREIEQQQQQHERQTTNNCRTPLNSPHTRKSSTDGVLAVLENTSDKLQKYLEENSAALDPKVLRLYPEKYLEMFNLLIDDDKHSDSSSSFAPETEQLPTVAHKMKQFQNIGEEIEAIFQDLLANIAELKDSCIVNGATYDERIEREPLITMSAACDSDTVVRPLLDELLDRVLLHEESQTDPCDLSDLNDPLRETAENLLETIERSLVADGHKGRSSELKRSRKFGPPYDRKPAESQFPPQQIRTTNPPEVSDSLQHIFFGADTSGEIIQSEFNLITEPGPSQSVNTALPHLPSVPSTDLSAASDNSNLKTLVENRFSGLTDTSGQNEIPLDLVTTDVLTSASSTSDKLKENFPLERKSPETDLHSDPLNKLEIDKSIAENLKTFQESMNEINKTNRKTVEMLASSTFSTPEGSLSILSTITESASRASKTSADRYPQFIARADTKTKKPGAAK